MEPNTIMLIYTFLVILLQKLQINHLRTPTLKGAAATLQSQTTFEVSLFYQTQEKTLIFLPKSILPHHWS